MRRFYMVFALTLFPITTSAQDWNCTDWDNLPQQGMNYCSGLEFDKADAELNTMWKTVMPRLKQWDAELEISDTGYANAVLEAQRAWIAFRDTQCTAEGFQVHGGTMQPLIINSCLAKMTRARTKQLSEILENGL